MNKKAQGLSLNTIIIAIIVIIVLVIIILITTSQLNKFSKATVGNPCKSQGGLCYKSKNGKCPGEYMRQIDDIGKDGKGYCENFDQICCIGI